MLIMKKLTITTLGRSIIPAWSRCPCSTTTGLVINTLARIMEGEGRNTDHLFNVHNFAHEIGGI